ncbi:hypothetical protein E2562_022475 [Oryza meyeriana var. granulata]|uniref:PIR2-like helical domain-containing protein n=1 Tax=Oryza meyeriana var. granulata TaxID=110450 RepID=A0A6G1BPC3_9ORYZ|nr:hypothetical protein E2562_022475 [Oryza meyeriana var. granulata]
MKKKKTTIPPGLTRSLVCRLLEKIHCHYLKAIAALPTDFLRWRHHPGLLKAGLCFGPMNDPVSNILLNTIWHDAILYLLEADANLHEAICRAELNGHNASGSSKDAYTMAAKVAWHPNPEALAKICDVNCANGVAPEDQFLHTLFQRC